MAFAFGDFTDGASSRAIEPSITEATPGEVQRDNLGNAFDALPSVSLLDHQQQYNEAGPDNGGLKPAYDKRTAGSDVDAMAAERGDAPIRNMIQPDDARARAKAAGVDINFDKPIPDTTADSIIRQHVKQQQRAAVIARNGDSILSGGVARFVTSSLLSLIDPINDAALMIPAAPEAFVAEKLAGAASVFERTMIRGAAGAANGAAGMAALEPLNYAMSKADYNDWTAGDALRNIFMGAAMGAAGHMVLGGMFGREHLDHETAMDATRGAIAQVLNDKPAMDATRGAIAQVLDHETAMDATRGAIAQVLNDKPVDIEGLIDHANATKAADRLEAWHAQQQRILADAEASRVTVEGAPNRSGEIAQHEATLSQMREQAAQMRGEVEGLKAKAVEGGMDAETQARFDEVNKELAGVIPKARRAALTQERDMLAEGRGAMDVSTGDPLEQARTATQAQGLADAAKRTDTQAAVVAHQLEMLKARAAQEEAAAQAARTSADRSERISQARVDSREAVLQNLMERDVRQFAAKMGATLDQGEAATIAREIRTAQPGEAADIIANHLNAVAKKGGKTLAEDIMNPPHSRPDVTQLRGEATGAAQDMAKRAMNPTPDPAFVRNERVNKAAIDSAPKLTGDVAKDTAEVTKLVQEATQQLQREIAAGRIVETQEMRDAMLAADHTENVGKAAADYAACIISRGT